MQNAAAAAGAVAAAQNGYYHHAYQTLMPSSGTPTSAGYQNAYNLTYVSVDNQPTTSTATAAAAAAAIITTPTVSHKTLPSILLSTGLTPQPPPAAALPATSEAAAGINMFMQPPPPQAPTVLLLSPGMPLTAEATTPTNMISCAQLDEAITAAAASNNSSNHSEQSAASSQKSMDMPTAAVLSVQSPSYAPLPFLLQQPQPQKMFKPQHQQQQQQQQQQQVFFSYGDSYSSWAHATSPCYSISGSSNHNPNLLLPRRPTVSPASSTGSLASDSQWSNRNRLTPAELLSVSPTPTSATPNVTGQQQPLSPLLSTSPLLNAPHPMLPFGSIYAGWPANWYELVLPPDRYIEHARNLELTVQPEQLVCHCKYDNLSLEIWKRFRGAQQTQTKFKLKMRLWRYLLVFINDYNLIEARVPILRFKDRCNGIEVDLNYNNSVGIKNTYLLQFYAQLDWRTRPLVVIVKLWAQYHDINDAKRMTISSYSLVLMVLHYLQFGCVPHVLPCLQAMYPEKFALGQQDCLDLDLIEPIEPYQTHNKQSLGEHLLGFLKYYSNFDFRNNAISIRTGGILPVAACRLAKSPKNDMQQWKELNIEEPFDLSNTARSVYDYGTFERVKAVIVGSARRLEHTLDISSIFSPLHQSQRP
ncbi:wisp, partial [Drosophila busckii]